MKALLYLALLLGVSLSPLCAQMPTTLYRLQDVTALTNTEARQAIPVSFEATVTYVRPYEELLFVQDGEFASFIRPPNGYRVSVGDRVLISGVTRDSFRPVVVARSLAVLHKATLPQPLPVTFDDLIRSRHDARLVTLRGRIRSADIILSGTPPVRSTRIQMVAETGRVEVNLDGYNPEALPSLLDAEVEITGVAAGKFDDKMQQTGVVLYTSFLSDVHRLQAAPANPWTIPITPMDRVLDEWQLHDKTPRVRVQGTITYYQPGFVLVLQDGAKSLWITTHTREALEIGDKAEAIGFPDAHDRLLVLNDAEILDTHIFDPIAPHPATWKQLAWWSGNSATGHINDLVSIEGRLVTSIREAVQDEYILDTGQGLFTAVYRHFARGELPPMRELAPGSRLRVTGICVAADVTAISPDEEVPFNILLRSSDDIALLAAPSPLNVRNLVLIASLLLLGILAVTIWGWILNAKVNRQTATLAHNAHFEQRRSRILEDINGSRPLNEILAEITEMVSQSLSEAPCWCEVVNTETLGVRPLDLEGLRVVHARIGGRPGSPLGGLHAALEDDRHLGESETRVLNEGARLATLAIETRRHYSDLRHRSEYDLLTSTHNRFSFDRQLEARLSEARQNNQLVGLVFIDLDDFKSVNDIYGHRVGDLFLQEAAQRMKRQLRSVDIPGRLGGDEFAVLIPLLRSRADLEEIAHRLENCFHPPFHLADHELCGSASVGFALFPEDATTREALLAAADAAMYAVKFNRRRSHPLPPQSEAAPDTLPQKESA